MRVLHRVELCSFRRYAIFLELLLHMCMMKCCSFCYVPGGSLQNSVGLFLFCTSVKWKSGPQSWCSMHIAWRSLSCLLHVHYEIQGVHGLWVVFGEYSHVLINLILNSLDNSKIIEKCRLYKLRDLVSVLTF